MDHFLYRDGVMHAEDVALPLIADAVGTPTYVYSTATIERHVRVFRDALAGIDARAGAPLVAYAVKANPNAAVLATLARLGLGADVVSGGELRRALAAGVEPARIVFSGVGKTPDEMALALRAGIGQFNLNPEPEAETLSEVAAAMGAVAPVAFRINPDVDAGTHAKISTGRGENKFGIPYDGAPAAYARAAALPGLAIQGVAVHIGSQLTDLKPLAAAFARIGALIGELRAAGHAIVTADLGGGLGVPYDATQPHPPSPADYGAMVATATAGWEARLIFEPGRVIVGNAGVLLTRVIRVKPGATSPFVIVDAAMNDLMRPALYDAWHDIRAIVPDGDSFTANVVGPVCETGDTFATQRAMDRVKAGDLLAFMTAGAYAATMASTYNSRPLTPELMVNAGEWAVVRDRQPIEAIIGADRLPRWLGGIDGMTRVRKAVFPVAGFGTRFLPATKAVPKELLPIVDRPLIQYAIDEALAAGIEQMIFVTGRGKHAIEDYFDSAFEIEADLLAKNKSAILDALSSTRLAPGQAAFVRQQQMAGLGHAVWCARQLIGDEPFAVLLPDELLWNAANPCLKQMVAGYEAKGGNVVAVVEVPEAHTDRYGIVDPGAAEGRLTEVRGMIEKPRAGTAPSRLAIVGRYILQPEVLDHLAAHEKGAGGEIQLTDAMARLIGAQPFHAWTFDGVRHDCGEKAGFIQANIALALERADIGPAIREYVRGL